MSETCNECKQPCDDVCYVGTLSELEQMRILGNGKSEAGYTFIHTIIKALWRARQLHPVFAEGKYQALGRIGAEYGELVQAVEKNEGTEREKAEIIDSIVVLIRAWLDEYEVEPK
ncbi:MAG: hypothetical protein K6F46_11755 [Desulfovibrio sp.]|nr:hypothetical protein [Desulfovibrio sp.]